MEWRTWFQMDDLIYVAISLGLFLAFAAAIFGYERVE
jgi:hypothetical protein